MCDGGGGGGSGVARAVLKHTRRKERVGRNLNVLCVGSGLFIAFSAMSSPVVDTSFLEMLLAQLIKLACMS